MDGLISYHVVGCNKRATNWFLAKSCPSTKEVKGIKINLDFIFNNFSVHRIGLRLVYHISRTDPTLKRVKPLLATNLKKSIVKQGPEL